MSAPLESKICLGCEGTGSFCGTCGGLAYECECPVFARQPCVVCNGTSEDLDELLIILDDEGPCECTDHACPPPEDRP